MFESETFFFRSFSSVLFSSLFLSDKTDLGYLFFPPLLKHFNVLPVEATDLISSRCFSSVYSSVCSVRVRSARAFT